MNLFRVYVDGELFYHPHLSKLAITEAKIVEDAINIDSLSLAAPYSHPYIHSIKPMTSVIVCKKGKEVVFEGRALDDGSDLYNTHSWKCESALAYLQDTLQPPFSYKGTIQGLLEQFLSEHNAKVETQKQFKIGRITVTDNNDYVAYSSSGYMKTLEAMKNKLINTHGGYFRVRYEADGKYLDYLSDFNEHSLQKVEFGKNILDVKIKKDYAERITALIPLGAKKNVTDENGNEIPTEERVDIRALNNGVNYIYDAKEVEKSGWIWGIAVWDDVTLPSNLLRKAKTRLSDLVKGVTSMQLTIVDESDTGADIGDIRARMYVECASEPHGIKGTYLCVSRTRDYLNPSGNTITIGASGVTLSQATVGQDKNISALEEEILGQTQKVDTLKIQIHECQSEITKTSNEIMSSVKDTYIDKNSLNQIKQDFQSSITQNSSEIRMDFTKRLDEIKEQSAVNQALWKEYIRFRGALIELGKLGNAFTAELSNEELAFKENGHKIAYISNNMLVITNAEIRNKLSLGNENRGWFDFLPRANGNLSIKWRDPVL